MIEKKDRSTTGSAWQSVSILMCVALAVLMIINNQMGGEGMWFWYSTAFLHGARLYSELHTALQPLFVLEMSTWMRVFGSKLVVYEIPSLLHASLLAFGTYLVLRESDWPDWQKAVVLLGSFVFTVGGHSYRFDDYHVLAELLIVYALWLLLRIGAPESAPEDRRNLQRVAWLGVLCGLTVVTRLTDGAALSVASALTLPFLLKRRRLASVALLTGIAVLTLVVTVLLTGDSLSAYASSSIFRAASSKGGTGSIFAAPVQVVFNTVPMLMTQKKVPIFLVLLFVLGYLVTRYRPQMVRFTVPLQVALTAVVLLFTSPVNRFDLRRGLLFEDLVLYLTLAMYLVLAFILFRFLRARQGRGTWDQREILILVPILEWASYSAGAAAEPLTNYYAPVALLLLLVPVLGPARRYSAWFNASITTIMGLVAINGIATKVMIPYSWQNYKFEPMFANRAVYHHPVFGVMYVDQDLLRFSEKVCRDIGQRPGEGRGELLSLPYPYPNYFCDTPPWHNYVQTFFDTATRGTIEQMMRELQTAPPEWIVYQRQMNIMVGAERLYNHGHPLAQRSLDSLIADKLASGQWTLVDFSDYLKPKSVESALGTGWYIIRTQPPAGMAAAIR